MSASENELLMQRISQLAGQINRHKNQGETVSSTPPSHGSGHARGSIRGSYRGRSYYRATPYSRPTYRGRGAYPTTVRNRTLVLNAGTKSGENSSSSPGTEPGDQMNAPSGDVNNRWISKRDRHMQLINSSVYDKQTEARQKAIEKTKQEKLLKREELEKKKLYSYLHAKTGSLLPSAESSHEVWVEGIQFRVAKGGRKLIRITGKCTRGNTCPFTHDPTKVAICPLFLQNKCPHGEICDLSHDPTPNRVPACVHFLRGNCSNPNCYYAHVRVNPAAPVCKDYALEGYCDKGADCTERHVHECPEYDETGQCSNKHCNLPHIERAGKKKAAAAAATAMKRESKDEDEDINMKDDDDISSDEDESVVGVDDVDSDALTDDDDEDVHQRDYIHL